MPRHLTGDDLERLRGGRLPADEVLAITEHLALCAACRDMSARRVDDAAGRFLAAVAAAEDDAADHPDPESRLYPYVDGTLDRASREEVEAHLEVCQLCREDVADLRAVEVRRRPSRQPLIAAGVAVAATVAVVVIVMRSWIPAPAAMPRTVPVQSSTVAAVTSDPWHEMLQSAVTAGGLEEPAVLKKLRPQKETMRGREVRRSTLRTPVGVVVESVRPRFSWMREHRATYRVSVFDGDRLIAQSPILAAEEWVCDRTLERGGVYSWQVEARKGRALTVMPDPSQGDALFEILDENAARDVADARRQFPDDHLLAGVLYARYGVRERAEEEMELATNDPKQAADARRLIDSIRHWQG